LQNWNDGSVTPARAPSKPGELRSPGGTLEATVLPDVGMLGWSLRHEGEELLGHPVPLERYAETGGTTGIPLLHPWANRLRSPEYGIAGRRVRLDMDAPNVLKDSNGLAMHGLVAASPHWELVEAGPSLISARLDYSAWPELERGFPFPHVLELTAMLSDDRLEVATALVPTGEQPVPVAFGFHPYLRLPGIERERWWVELPVTSRMELDELMLPTGRSQPVRIPPGPLGDRVFDDAFDGLASPPEFVLSGAGRQLHVLFLEGYRFAQVYAPPGSDFICFEPMTAPDNPFESDRTLLAQPGSRYVARFEVGVSAISRPPRPRVKK
jgi:galactose mutarotase-like enzyme